MPREFTPEEIRADSVKWQRLEQELEEPDPKLPAFYEEMFGAERHGAYPADKVRTTIPEDQHGDMRADDVYTWVDRDADGNEGYWLWERSAGSDDA